MLEKVEKSVREKEEKSVWETEERSVSVCVREKGKEEKSVSVCVRKRGKEERSLKRGKECMYEKEKEEKSESQFLFQSPDRIPSSRTENSISVFGSPPPRGVPRKAFSAASTSESRSRGANPLGTHSTPGLLQKQRDDPQEREENAK
ncbi:hypothetical protein TNIN_436581 [Trichonephila inaurata madagascariensis]|uniref:Uncharacterized protein n=1 Tax=Trichonephila inaurata madagascariensis TaxID=2747483 RepID=A0A8X7CBW5_9ARAC|nr:hypothetical protein TNIN_436581 [Trichonephila inaurata madagascariensis]